MNKNSIKILVPEQTEQIITALNSFRNNPDAKVINKVDLPTNWYQLITSQFNDFQKNFIEKTNINIQEDCFIFQCFSALNLNLYDAILIGNHYTSKEVFLYTILFFSEPDKLLSSCFVTEHQNETQIWTDCAFNIIPNPKQLAIIAKNATDFYQDYTKKTPIVSFLSYATFDSAGGKPVELTKEAHQEFLNLTKNQIQSFAPIQFDACVNSRVFKKKTQQSEEQMSNVLVFPDLNAANISYKVANQLAKMEFYGPFVLGSRKLVCDLSRSANAEEIIQTIQIMIKLLKK